jgi:hypothetical protein
MTQRHLATQSLDNRLTLDLKEALVAKMQADLLAMAPRYYGHPDFAARFIAKKYMEACRKGAR